MSKHTYRYLRRHGSHAAGDEAQLTEEQAIGLENEAPGTIECVNEPAPPKSAPPKVTKEKP